MGWITGVIIAALVLVVLGIGVEAFLSALWNGAQQVGKNPVVKNATSEAKEFVRDSVKNATDKIGIVS